MLLTFLTLLIGCTAALDIYQEEVGVVNGRRLWYPEWRMQDLLRDSLDVSQEQRSLEQKIDVDRDSEFHLTDAEIEEVLHPKLKSTLSLERRIEKVLGMRRYHDSDEEDLDEEEEETQDAVQLQKGQQRRLPRKTNNLFKKQERNKRGANNNSSGKRGGGRSNNKNNKRGKRGSNKRGKRRKRGGNKHQVFKYTNKQYKNICLDPPDRYRTCLSREADPTNDHIGCDTILRNSYNLGAQYLEKGKWPPPSEIPDPNIIYPIVPYQEPYLEDDEMIHSGIMHITLLQSTETLNCDERIRVEETILTYLHQNVGDDNTFKPICVFLEEDAVTEEIVRDADGRIAATTALKVEVVYRTKKYYNDQLEESRRRMMEMAPSSKERNLLYQCSPANHHLCCSQDSINAEPGAFCKSINCNFSDCRKRGTLEMSPARPGTNSRPGMSPSRPGSSGRPGRPGISGGSRPQRPGSNRPKSPSRQNIRHTNAVTESASSNEKLYGTRTTGRMARRKNPNRCFNTRYKGKSLETVLKKDTVFKNVEMALSLLNDTDTSLVASCSVNWYIVRNKGIPSQTCEEYNERDCINNEDLDYDEDEVRCIEPSSAPSQAPSMSAMPSSGHTVFPTMYPTLMQTTELHTSFPTLEE